MITLNIFSNSEYKTYTNLINNLYQSSNIEEIKSILNKNINKLIKYDSLILLIYKDDGITALSCYVENLDTKHFDDYLNYYQNFDLYKKVIHQLTRPPVVNRVSDYLDYNEWKKNEHRADFLKPQNIYHISCMEIIHNNKIMASLSLHRSKQHEDFSYKELCILKLLAPIIKNIYLSIQSNNYFETFNDKLTPREKQIFPMLVKNYSTSELSSYFAISPNTIKTHIKNILRKANCSSRFELTVKLQESEQER